MHTNRAIGPDFHEAFNDKEIIDAIVKMHQDEDYDVREASTEALAALAKLGKTIC